MTRIGTAGIERAPASLFGDAALCAAWDERAVGAPGGDMHQGSAFAADRERRGIKVLPLYVDGTPLLVTIRRLPILGLGTASVSRGPAIRVDAAPEEILRPYRCLKPPPRNKWPNGAIIEPPYLNRYAS
jgi:hypothetical protein